MRHRPKENWWLMIVAGLFGTGLGCSSERDSEYRTVTRNDIDQGAIAHVSARAESPPLREPSSPDQASNSDERLAGVEPDVSVSETSTTLKPKLDDLQPTHLRKQITVLIPQRTLPTEEGGDVLRVTFGDLDLEEVLNVTLPPPDVADHFPDWLGSLEGQRVRIRGFMCPPFRSEGIGGFTFVRDIECAFGAITRIHHMAEVVLRNGETTDYIHGRPFDVEDVFHIRPDVDGDDLWQLYMIDDAIVLDE